MEVCSIENLGYLAALYLFYRTATLIYQIIFQFYFSKPIDPSKLGQWAVITGSTDGIGKAYAFALAKAGMDIVLVSRSPTKLKDVAGEIERKHKVKTKTVVVDFTSDDKAYVPQLEKELIGLKVGVLVNNVGMFYKYPMPFLEIDPAGTSQLISVNITSANVITRLVLPSMVSRGRGAIINVSSISSRIFSPLFSVYASTKAYLLKLSESLEIEYGDKGIVIQCVTPGFVVTSMSKLEQPGIFEPSAEVFVKSALGCLGISKLSCGYWAHDLQVAILSLLPRFLQVTACQMTGRLHQERLIKLQ